MSLSRRFLNLVVDNRTVPGAKSLCCMDLDQRRHSLFDTATPSARNKKTPPARNKKTTTRTRAPKRNAAPAFNKIRLPSASFNVRASDSDLTTDRRFHFFSAAADRRVFCWDQSGRGFLLEADTPRMLMMPCLHRPKTEPISLYVPDVEPDFNDRDGGGGGILFIMDRKRVAKPAEPEGVTGGGGGGGFQFEALVYRKTCINRFPSKSWHCERVPPPPPYVHGGGAGHVCLEISSYALVKGGSAICVSVDGTGTYCLDAASDIGTSWSASRWSEVGKWTLPFRGEVQYVPELKLWLGFTTTAEDQSLLAAADLSAMDSQSQPPVLGSWKEAQTPKRWQEVQDPQLVYLGSRRFCVARFFRTGTGTAMDDYQNVTILTGVEVVRGPNVYGRVHLEMIKHKSLCHKSRCGEDTITAVF